MYALKSFALECQTSVDNRSEPTHRSHALDGLRGYAAAAVVVFHAILIFDPGAVQRLLSQQVWSISNADLWEKMWLAAFNGAAAVELFFMLSGCVLIRSLRIDLGTYSAFFRVSLAFTIRRVLRIYPVLVVSVLAMGLAYPDAFPWTAVVSNMALWSASVLGPSWTLQVEMLAVPLMLVLAVSSRKWGVWSQLAILVYACIARKKQELLGVPMLGEYGYLFVFGTLVPTRVGAATAALLKPFGWIPVLAAFIFLRQLVPGMELASAVLGSALLALLYYDKDAVSSPFFVSTMPAFLGQVSFGLYLWNVLFLQGLPLLPRGMFPADPVAAGLAASVVILPLSAFLAAISYRLLELPAIRLGKRISKLILSDEPPLHSKGSLPV